MSRLPFLLAALAALWPLAAWTIPPEAATLPALRRIWLTDRSQLPPGDWTSVSRAEFEQIWAAAEKAGRGLSPVDVHALRLRLRLQGDCLVGEGAVELTHRGTGPATVRLEPWNVVLLNRPVLSGEPAIVGLPEGGAGLEMLVNRPGRQTLVFEAGLRGSATPGGLEQQIDLPAIPLIELQVWLPPQWRPQTLDARHEFLPLADRDRLGYRGWRCSLGGSGPTRLSFRVQSPTHGFAPAPVVAQVKSNYTLTPLGLEGQWQVEATGVRPGTEWYWSLDEDWELLEVMDHTQRRPLSWRRLPAPLDHLVAVELPVESDRCSWRVRGRPKAPTGQSSEPPVFRLGGFLPWYAHRCEETIALRLDRLLALKAFNPGDFLVTVWNVAEGDEATAPRRFELVGARPMTPLPRQRPTFQATPPTHLVEILQEHWLHLAPSVSLLQVRLRARAPHGAMQLQMQLPADWQLVDLRWTDGAGTNLAPPIHASAQGDLLTLQAAMPWTQLEVHAQLRRNLELSVAKPTALEMPTLAPLGVRDFRATWAVTLARNGAGSEAAPLLTARWVGPTPTWEPPSSGGPWREVATVPDYSWQTREMRPRGALELSLMPARFTGNVQTSLSQAGQTGRLEYRLVAAPQTGASSVIALEFSEPAPTAVAWRVAEGSNAISAYRRLDETHAEIVLSRPVCGTLELQGEADWPLDQPIPLLRWAFAPLAELWLRPAPEGRLEVAYAGWLGPLPAAADGAQRWLYDRSTQKVRLFSRPLAPIVESGRSRSVPWGLLSWHWRDGMALTGRLRLPSLGLDQLCFRLPAGRLVSARADHAELAWENNAEAYTVRIPRATREVELKWQVPVHGQLLARAVLAHPEWSEPLDFVQAREELWTDLPTLWLGTDWEVQGHSGAYRRPLSQASPTVWAVTGAGLMALLMIWSLALAAACWAPRWLGLGLAALWVACGLWTSLNLEGLGAALGAGLAALAGGCMAWRWPGGSPGRAGTGGRAAAVLGLLLGLTVPAWGARDGSVFVVYLLPGDNGKPDSRLVLVPTEDWQKLKRRATPTLRSVWVCSAIENGTWNGELLRVSSKVTVYVTGATGRWPLRLSPGQRLARIMVDGEARTPLLEGGQAWLELSGPGEHECEIHWETSASAPPTTMSSSLLEAPVHGLSLTVPAGAAWTLRPATAVPVSPREGQAWYLPPTQGPWSLAGGPRRGEMRTRAIQEVMLTPEGRGLRSLWNVTVTDGMIAEWTAWWPASWLIKSIEVSAASGRVASPRLSQWHLDSATAEHSRLVLKLAEPVTGEFRILIEAEAMTNQLAALAPCLDAVGVWGLVCAVAARGFIPDHFHLDLPKVVDGERDEDLLILRGERVTWSAEKVGTPVPQPTLLRAASVSPARQVFRRGATDPRPSLKVRPILQAPALQQTVQFQLRGTELTMEAELTIPSMPPWATRLEITPPAGMRLTSVDGPLLANWEPGADRHILWLLPGGGDAGGTTTLHLRGWMGLEAPVPMPSVEQLRGWCCTVGPGPVTTRAVWRESEAAARDRPGGAVLRQIVGCDGATWRLAAEVHLATPVTGPLHVEVRHWPEGAAFKWEANQPLSVLLEPGTPGEWRVRLTASEPLAWIRLLGAWPVGTGAPWTVPQLSLDHETLPAKMELGAGVIWANPEGQNEPARVLYQAPEAATTTTLKAEERLPERTGGPPTPGIGSRVKDRTVLYLIPCPALLILLRRWWQSRLVPAAPAS